MTSQPITLSDGTVLSEYGLIDRLLEVLGSNTENRVYLLDTVMRLAPTVGYDGFDLGGYKALRAYGMEARPTLSGGDLTVDNIIANYWLDRKGQPVVLFSTSPLPDDVLDSYSDARARKLKLSDHMRWVFCPRGSWWKWIAADWWPATWDRPRSKPVRLSIPLWAACCSSTRHML